MWNLPWIFIVEAYQWCKQLCRTHRNNTKSRCSWRPYIYFSTFKKWWKVLWCQGRLWRGRGSSGGSAQYMEYGKLTGKQPNTDSTRSRHYQFVIDFEMSEEIFIAWPTLVDRRLELERQVVSANGSSLLGLFRMDRLEWYFNNLKDHLLWVP